MSAKTRFNKQQDDINSRAGQMYNLCINSQFDPETGEVLDDLARINNIPTVAANYPMFESISPEHQQFIISGAQTAIREYEETFGEFPRADIMASAHKAMENMLLLEGRNEKGTLGEMMLESLGQTFDTNSDNIEIRARTVGVILPVLLSTATLDAVTLLPGDANEVEIFKIRRRTGTSFGDFKAGTEIDQLAVGQYSSMRQRYPFVEGQQPDGSKTEFTFTSKTDLANTTEEIPFNKKSVSLFVNRKKIARDLDGAENSFMGKFDVDGTTVTITCDVNYDTGTLTVSTGGIALPTGTLLDAEFEVDIEKRPDLIPTIEYDMEGKKIRPFQRAIAADATIQSMFTMQREFNIDIKSMQQGHLRNVIAAEKSQGHLRDMNYACTRETTFNIYVEPGEEWRGHRQRLQETLLNVSEEILKTTKVTGMTGLYAGRSASTIIKTLGAPDFIAPANYKQTNDIHYAGKLFGVWKVFEAPIVIGDFELLCYGRGSSYNEAGYVAGDAIPATLYTHPILPNLRARDTLYELSYGEIHPYDGELYFYRVKLIDEAPTVESEELPAAA
ncbi:hypothetical protein [Vibrio parahaemolyticus]|uniref:hypothetical protein n=1 Tax=Vibrio parahaemolyticus TaxID=670 RepID=UPI000C9AEFBD|nr:hypothetical protein [Vibrio parahaemolyticus]PMS91979.1 hypothetical protein C1T06_23090 [Vibrio parahaemolyticus]